MRKIWCFLIMLGAILSFGCAPRGDWISETLTLVDVSGTWEGTIRYTRLTQTQRSIRLTLRQSGARVTGEMDGGSRELTYGKIQGRVNGDVFTFEATGIRGEATVDGAEMSGQAGGSQCPCFIVLRRAGRDGNDR